MCFDAMKKILSHVAFSPAFMQSKPKFPVTEQRAFIHESCFSCMLATIQFRDQVRLNWGLEQQLMQSFKSLATKGAAVEDLYMS